MTETYIVVLLWITTLGLFVFYNKFHKHLNKTWDRNMQYSLNGNDGKELSLLRVNGIGFSFYGGERMVWREILCMFLGLIKWPVAVVAFLRLLVLFLK